MASFLGMVQRVQQISNPPIPAKSAEPLSFGILGAANIGYGTPPAVLSACLLLS
jgi:hypothetical protein